MKIKIIVLFVCFLAFASISFAQSKTDYLGSWSNGRAFQMSVDKTTITFDSKGGKTQTYNYRDITPKGSKTYHLEITSPTKNTYFSKFLSLKIAAEGAEMNDLTITNYNSLADLKAAKKPQGNDSWFRDGAASEDEDSHAIGTLQVGKTESVILYFGEESGDYAGYCFTNNSAAGKKILAACKNGEECEVVGEIDGASACKVPGLEADLSASGKIISVTSVKSLAVKTKVSKTKVGAVSPEQVVKDLYAAQKADKGPFFQKKSRALVDKYFMRELADAIWKDATTASDGVGALDFDPLYYAQDTQITNFVIEKADENNNVKVRFKNMGKDEEITYFLTTENTASKVWKIDSIMYSDAEDLGSILEYGMMTEAEMKESDSANKLDGDYMVGSVKCNITTNKSGFWARVKCDDQENFQVVDTETLTFGTFNPKEKGRKGQFISPEYGIITKFVDASGKEIKVTRIKN